MIKCFTVPGEPRGKGRPRFGRGRTYTDDKTAGYEMLVRACWYQTEKAPREPCADPIRITITACCLMPASASQRRKNMMSDGKIKPTKRPDVDNIAKIVMDALNGVAYVDDSQVVELSVRKKYVRDDPCIVVCVESLII